MANIVPLDQPGLSPPAAKPLPELDRYGRYRIPDPRTGKEKSWTRATTWAKSVADTYGLTKWQLRMTALGLARRPDLLAKVAAVLDPESVDGKRRLDELTEKAKEMAAAGARANLGDALHAWAEAHDTGRQVPYIPQPFDRDLAAYEKAMRAVKVSKNYVEKIGLVESLEVAGTMDRVVAFGARKLPMIGDIKTGQDLGFSWSEIVIQLALYAHSDWTYDPSNRQHKRMLEVDKEQALVVHLPAGEAKCDLYLVDITSGWRMAQTCGQVRAWRNRKDLAQLLVSEDVS